MYYNSMNEAIYHRSMLRNNFLDVMLTGITNPNSSYRIMHNLPGSIPWDNYVFEYIVSGSGYIEYDNKKIKVSAGDMYFLNKLKKHVYYSDKNKPFTKYFAVLHGTFVDSLVNSFGITESVIIKKTDTREIFQKIFELSDTDNLPFDEIAQCALKLVQKIKPHDYNKQLTNLPSLAELIKNYLDENISQKITLDDISNTLNISKSHIERLFVEKYNTSPLKYFSERKMNYAHHLLMDTDYTLTEIADALSFGDAKYLSKCIKNYSGLTPSELKKQKDKKKK